MEHPSIVYTLVDQNLWTSFNQQMIAPHMSTLDANAMWMIDAFMLHRTYAQCELREFFLGHFSQPPYNESANSKSKEPNGNSSLLPIELVFNCRRTSLCFQPRVEPRCIFDLNSFWTDYLYNYILTEKFNKTFRWQHFSRRPDDLKLCPYQKHAWPIVSLSVRSLLVKVLMDAIERNSRATRRVDRSIRHHHWHIFERKRGIRRVRVKKPTDICTLSVP